MKKIAFIVLTVLISFNAKAEIESRELLDEIFYGCASDDEDWLTTGELYAVSYTHLTLPTKA